MISHLKQPKGAGSSRWGHHEGPSGMPPCLTLVLVNLWFNDSLFLPPHGRSPTNMAYCGSSNTQQLWLEIILYFLFHSNIVTSATAFVYFSDNSGHIGNLVICTYSVSSLPGILRYTDKERKDQHCILHHVVGIHTYWMNSCCGNDSEPHLLE